MNTWKEEKRRKDGKQRRGDSLWVEVQLTTRMHTQVRHHASSHTLLGPTPFSRARPRIRRHALTSPPLFAATTSPPKSLLRGRAWHEVAESEIGDDEGRALLWVCRWKVGAQFLRVLQNVSSIFGDLGKVGGSALVLGSDSLEEFLVEGRMDVCMVGE